MRRTYLFLGLVSSPRPRPPASSGGAKPARCRKRAVGSPPAEPAEPTQSRPLPLTQVVLFNTGVAYFQREGTIDGDTRIDLTFPVGDVNDLLKSLVFHDLGGGKVRAVSYDGQEPIDRTLKAFALDLAAEPDASNT